MASYMDYHTTIDITHTPQYLSLSPSIGLWPTENYGKDVIIGIIDDSI